MNIREAQATRVEIEALLNQRRGSRGRRVAWLLALLALMAAGYGAWRLYRPAPPTSSGAPASLRYVTVPAAVGDFVVKVTATGTVQPTNKLDVSSELSGTIRRVFVDFNSRVKAGDPLAELDLDKLRTAVDGSRARLAMALAAVETAKVNVAESKLNYDRKIRLAADNVSSLQDRDTAKAAHERAVAALANAQANVDAARAELAVNEINLVKARIVSPIDGVVLMRKADPGQTVASTLQAPVLFTIAEDLRKMEAQVDVDEADVGKVREGQKAQFSVDAYPDRKFDAIIRELRFGSEVVQGVVTYKAVLTTDNGDLLLRPGMTATADIFVDEIKGALTVPMQALRFTPPDTQGRPNQGLLQRLLPGPGPMFRQGPATANPSAARVFVLRDGQPVAVRVRVGSNDGQRTQILGGDLHAGDQVIVDVARRRN